MTAPGPIQMLGIPHVSPGPVMQAPGFAQQVEPGLSALANLLALRQRKAELDQQAQELQFRVATQKLESENQVRMGEAMKQIFPPTTATTTAFAGPQVTLPTDLAAGGTMRMNAPQATNSVLGTTILNADPKGLALAAPYLQPAIAAEYRRQEERQRAAVNRNTEIRISGGLQHLVDRNTGRSAPILDEQTGQPLTADKGVDKEALDLFVDTRTHQYVYLPRRAGALPPYYQKAGNITEGERRDAKLFTRAVGAYRIASRLPPIPEDIITAMADAAQRDPNMLITSWVGRTKLPQEVRQALLAWNQVLTSGIYSYSGAAVTVGEFLGEKAKIPTSADTWETMQVKRDLIEMDLRSLRKGGERALQGSGEDLHVGDNEDTPEEYR